jgi:RNA polymerase sigma-70 factor (ECF subfamily)
MFNNDELNRLYRFALSLSNAEASAYDLLQSALEKYLKSHTVKPSGDGRLRLLRTIIRNLFIDQYRKEKRHPHQDFESFDALISLDMPGPEDVLIESEQIVDILDGLHPSERELLHLWALEQHTAKEIAAQLDCPRGTVLSRIHRLRQKIQNMPKVKAAREIY